MHAKPELNGMENVFGQLACEAKWTSEAKRIASNVQNAFRQEVRYFLRLFHHLHFSLIPRSEIASLAKNDARLNSLQLSLAYVINRGSRLEFSSRDILSTMLSLYVFIFTLCNPLSEVLPAAICLGK